jgi:Ca2+-binding EF-hand superfamily protein
MEAEESNRELLVFKLGVLQRKENELASLIQSIDATFTDMGFRIDNSVSVIKKKGNPSSGIRMKGKLSFRGKEKAEEYFDVMDIDRDGLLNFEDFRGILELSSRIYHLVITCLLTSTC